MRTPHIRVLVLTTEWPSKDRPTAGEFVARQVDELRAQGAEVDVMPFQGRFNSRKYVEAYLGMRRRMRSQRYDLIHAHFGQAGIVGTLQLLVPVVVTFHGSDLYGFPAAATLSRLKSWMLRAASRIAARRATEVIVVSARLAQHLSRREVHVIPMAIAPHFSPVSSRKARALLAWPMEERTVLFVGDPESTIKRYQLARKAVELVAETQENVRLRVCWNQPSSRVPLHMSAADVLIITSVHEGGPLIVSEALACGLPVVSVDVGLVRERLSGLANCFVCSDDEAETIALHLRQVLDKRTRVIPPERPGCSESDVAQNVLQIYRLALARD